MAFLYNLHPRTDYEDRKGAEALALLRRTHTGLLGRLAGLATCIGHKDPASDIYVAPRRLGVRPELFESAMEIGTAYQTLAQAVDGSSAVVKVTLNAQAIPPFMRVDYHGAGPEYEQIKEILGADRTQWIEADKQLRG